MVMSEGSDGLRLQIDSMRKRIKNQRRELRQLNQAIRIIQQDNGSLRSVNAWLKRCNESMRDTLVGLENAKHDQKQGAGWMQRIFGQ